MKSQALKSSTPFQHSIRFIKRISRALTFKRSAISSEQIVEEGDGVTIYEKQGRPGDKMLADDGAQQNSGQQLPSQIRSDVSPEIVDVDKVDLAADASPRSGDETKDHERERSAGASADIIATSRSHDLAIFDDQRLFKEPFTSNKDLMDDMFDAVLIMRTFSNTKFSPRVAEEPNRVMTNGTNNRETFPPSNSPTQEIDNGPIPDVEARSSESENDGIEVFPARKKALQFLYLRFLVNAGIYDLPPYDFTVEDADRLVTCGMIGLEHLDHVFVSSMVGHGMVRRVLRSHGFTQVDGTVVPPCVPWTIPIGTCPPTDEEVSKFIAGHEKSRFDRRYARFAYRLAAFERPVMSDEYVYHRLARDGLWGFKRMAGLEDEEVENLLGIKDMSYTPPETYLASRCAVLDEDEINWEEAEPKLFNDEVDLDVEDTEPEFFEPTELQRGRPSAVSTERPSSALVSSDGASRPVSERGPSSVYKGKKRARSPSPTADEDVSDTHRRVRPRTGSQEHEPSASADKDAMPSVFARGLDATNPHEASSDGKKRGREEEDEYPVSAEPSPAKKAKIAESAEAFASHEPSDTDDLPPAQETSITVAEQSFPSPRGTDFPEPLPVGSVARCKSSRERPPTRPTRDPTKVYDAYYHLHFNKPPEGRNLRAEDAVIQVRPDCEKGPKYAILYDLITPSWAELCARWKLPLPARELGHGTQPEPGVEYPTSTPTHIVPSHKRLRRMPMEYLDKPFPHIHPRYYGQGLTRQNAESLDEVFPELFPPGEPSRTQSERDGPPLILINEEPDVAAGSSDIKPNRE